MMNLQLSVLLLTAAISHAHGHRAPLLPSKQPNVLIVLADDLGF